VHLIDQEQGPRARDPSDLADLAHQVSQVLLGVAGVRDPEVLKIAVAASEGRGLAAPRPACMGSRASARSTVF
jgi:hypothetical protein